MKPYIYPYNLGSKSAKLLAEALNTIRIRSDGKFKHVPSALVINWGSSNPGKINASLPHLNKPNIVERSINKLSTFKWLGEASFNAIPKWTTDKTVAKDWLDAGHVVIARLKLRSSQGQGIEVIKPGENLPNTPLYTKLFSKDKEYRVHVFKGSVIDFVQKKLKTGFTPKPYIRSHDNGWVFCREGVELPQSVSEAAVEAVKLMGLDFGAVDLAISKKGTVCVFEINTAPGIEGTTVVNYTKAITAYLEQLQNAPTTSTNHS